MKISLKFHEANSLTIKWTVTRIKLNSFESVFVASEVEEAK